MNPEAAWNGFARVNASERWRRQSAAMGRPMTEAIVAEAQVQAGMQVLDIASGSGEPAISLAALLGGTGRVVATDISPGPLKIAEQRARERGLNNMEFVPADVQQLPFSDGVFDRATSRLGVMFFPDLPRALREIRRVLKPGGRVSFLAWGAMRQPYFDATLGSVLRLLPELKLPESGLRMFQFAEAGVLSGALQQAGFHDAREIFQEVPWNWPGTPEDLWEWFRAVTIPFQSLLQAIPVERQDEVNAQVIDVLRRYYNGREVEFAASIVLAVARG
jgi:ubiquinone/menaquinone biosynthesis C-methylase UbiE